MVKSFILFHISILEAGLNPAAMGTSTYTMTSTASLRLTRGGGRLMYIANDLEIRSCGVS